MAPAVEATAIVVVDNRSKYGSRPQIKYRMTLAALCLSGGDPTHGGGSQLTILKP